MLTIAGLGPKYRGQVTLPVLGKVTGPGRRTWWRCGWCRGSRRLFADRAEELAHGFGAHSAGSATARPGGGAGVRPPRRPGRGSLPCRSPRAGPAGLPVGRCEDGPCPLRLHGTHLLIAGATGRGRALTWWLVRALLPAMAAGLVRVHACDPKLMELAFGRELFERFGQYAAARCSDLLEADVAEMQARAERSPAATHHTPPREFPFVVVLVDEVAFLTAYQADRKLRERTLAALATLTTQGRAVGYAWSPRCKTRAKKSSTSATCSPTRSPCGWTNPTRWTWCSATAPTTAAPGRPHLPPTLHRRGGRVRAAGSLPRPGAGAGRVRHRCRHPGHGHARHPPARWPMRETAWRTDEPCPVCGTGLSGHNGTAGPAAECPGAATRARSTPTDDPGRRLVTGRERTTRAERLAMPLARDVVRDLAAEHGACLRPVQLRRTDIDTGHVEQVLIPCGHTLATVCPSCAERAKILRAAQCREGWHLDHEPVIDPDPATEDQRAAGHRPRRGPSRPGPPRQRRPRHRPSWTS